jgi:hypothetical protein
MSGPMRTLACVVGGVLYLATAASVLRTLVVPRGLGSRLIWVTWRILRATLRVLARPLASYQTRDRILAWLGPLVLVSLLLLWMTGLLVAFGLLLYGISGEPPRTSFREAGSSLFTLGFASTDRVQLSAVDFLAAATGPLLIALVISYLPTLYAAYNRRETEVTLLESRAGEPAWGPELLARQALAGTIDQLRELYGAWERLAADIGESHSNYRVLLTFRSPRPYRSWIVGLIAVMDAAAMHQALAPDRAPAEARLMLRAGFTALRDIASASSIPFDRDPLPSAPILLNFDEYADGVAHAVAAGFPAERTAKESWPDFQGWRVNYEAIGYEIGRISDSVRALWTGPRDWPGEPIPPKRPPQRSPANPHPG